MRATTANIGLGELEKLQDLRSRRGSDEQRVGMVWLYYIIALEHLPLSMARARVVAFNERFEKPLALAALAKVLRNVELDWAAVAASGSRCVLRSGEAYSRIGLTSQEADEVGIPMSPKQKLGLKADCAAQRMGDDPRAAGLLDDDGRGLAELAASLSDSGMSDEEVALELGCGQSFVTGARWGQIGKGSRA